MQKEDPVMRCGDCRYFACEKKFEKPCVKLGKLEVSKQCSKFKPNTRALDEFLADSNKSTVLQAIGQLVALIPTKKLHILAAVLYNEKTTRKYGFHFMQIVYIPWRSHDDPPDVVCFKRMYLMEAAKKELRLLSADGKVYYVQYDYKDSPKTAPLYQSKAYTGTVYTLDAYKALKKKLRSEGITAQLVDTEFYKLRAAHRKFIVEDVEKEEKEGKEKSKSKYDIYDLSTMAREVEKGFIVRSKSYKRKKEDAVVEDEVSETFSVSMR